jgi:imidazolonepropionase-like amidohydrolase
MGLEREAGTIEPGKRADIFLTSADLLADIKNIRSVTSVVAAGRLYDSAALWQSVGFRP